MRKSFIMTVAILLVAGTMVFAAGEQEYPSRDITNVLVWGAGGGTDTANRVVMEEMSNILGVNINVENITGGVAGSEGMTQAYARDHDGYTLAGISESVVTAGVQGGWDLGMDVWDFFIIGGSPDVVSVTPDAPYETIEELAEAAISNPGSIDAGASASGSIHHLNLLAFEKAIDGKFNFVPYNSSAASQNAGMTGEVTVVITSVAEQAELIRAGNLRPLAVLVPNDFDFRGTPIPTAFDRIDGLDEYLPIEQAIGFAVAKDVPTERKEVLWDAFDEAMGSDVVQDWLAANYYVASGATGDRANNIFAELEKNFSWTLWDMGAASINPEELGIPRP